MAEAAHDPALKAGFEQHLRQTHNHLARLEQVFRMLGHSASGKTCYAMKGLIDEGEEVVGATGNENVIDAALIGAAQKVEHYEIAGYGTARAFAQRLGRSDAAALLQQTLDEEGATNEKLTQLAERHINQIAAATS